LPNDEHGLHLRRTDGFPLRETLVSVDVASRANSSPQLAANGVGKNWARDYNLGVKPVARVASPPLKPLLVFDGDCNFCAFWVRRWQRATGSHVEYQPFQDPRIAAQFPELACGQFEGAVQLILPDGAVHSGADAVFRALAGNPHEVWLQELYEHSPVFAAVCEVGYRFVARNRRFFSAVTQLFWGRQVEPPAHKLVRWIFLRAVGINYLFAFLSLSSQIIGLVGHDGIAPAENLLKLANQQATANKIGLDRYHLVPTLCWYNTSDGFLKFQCAAGIALAGLVIAGIAPAPCLFLLWLIYLSLTTVCGVFLGFQWDNLLLETGLLAIFFAPLQIRPRRPSSEAPPSRTVLWLLRWLVFRLMFESGCVKLMSRDLTWRHLTALNFHFETQPLPTWIGWYAHQMPAWLLRASTAVMFGIELAVPFLIFLPRRLRHCAAAAFAALQVLILLTGNYCFFNWLTLALCLPLLDDALLHRFLPACWRTKPPVLRRDSWARWPVQVTLALAVIVACASLVQLFATFHVLLRHPDPAYAVFRWVQPLRSFNNYGLFAVMTTTRLEIVVEGSNDGESWSAYEFKYKPGDLQRRPGFVAPHQPRLDWQMWFAALGDYRQNPWFVNFCIRLLQGSPEVTALLERNPFPKAPPRFIRAELYEYHFTDAATRRRSGEWWRRELKGIYLPPFSLEVSSPPPAS